MTFAEIRDFCNGKVFKSSEGISMTYRYEDRGHGRISVYGEPTQGGKRTKAYIESREVLGDDWTLDLYNNPESEITAIAQIVGGADTLDRMCELDFKAPWQD